jgi:uncharacterized membrane protein YdjX (TVP38/TMEM64 family)
MGENTMSRSAPGPGAASDGGDPPPSGHPRLKLAIAVLAVAGAVVLAWRVGVFDVVSISNVDRLRAFFDGLGWWAPGAFVGAWLLACILFLPGLPISILGGLVFGAVWGTVWTTVGANLGAAAAFLIGRYAARGVVARQIGRNPGLARIDRGVRRHGWRMLMVTRLVPVFPFNIQNYVYGLTDIPLRTYVLVNVPCMLPGTIAYNFAAGSVRTGDLGRTLWYLGVAAVLFVLLSLVPGWLRRRLPAATEAAGDSGTGPRDPR